MASYRAQHHQRKELVLLGVTRKQLMMNSGQGQNRAADTGIFRRAGPSGATMRPVTYGAYPHQSVLQSVSVQSDNNTVRPGMPVVAVLCRILVRRRRDCQLSRTTGLWPEHDLKAPQNIRFLP